MFKRKILLLSIFLLGIIAVSAVSAADNATDDVVSVSDDTQELSVDSSDDAVAAENDESEVLRIDESNQDDVLQSNLNTTVEVLSATNASDVKTDEVLGAANPDSAAAEPVLKAKKTKVVKMNVKYKWTTKKIGKFKIKARLWKVPYAYGYMNYLDIHLYKNGKQVKYSGYASKYLYKENGRWKWWPKWRHGGGYNPFHRYINCVPIKAFKVKFRY